ncbi:MAG: hypothetical protein QM493_06280 [Sulfurovum sp.]
MNLHIFQTPQYREIINKTIFETIEYLFSKNQDFAIACEVKYIKFKPPLPSSIVKSFEDTVLFILSGYTFESASIDEESFSFEAGFGADNIGSTVSLPLLGIKQIFVGEHPIVINLSSPPTIENIQELHIPKKNSKLSMEALLNNPKNKKLKKLLKNKGTE